MVCRLGCIADDYTGATDLSSMLARAGLRVIQCFGTPAEREGLCEAEAVVVALKSRSIAAPIAVRLSLAALSFLQTLGAERFFFKYCSTFDSTAEGNIGPVADALANALNTREVLFCPAFPENGRTVYCGHSFVDGVPLHESGMRHHPLTPMSDSNLVRVLQSQSQRAVVSLPLRAEPTSWQAQNYIVDAIADEDLRHAARLARQHRLLTGASAVARYWAEELPLHRSENGTNTRPAESRPSACVILAGSCSPATRRQVAEFERENPVLHLDLLSATSPHAAATAALAWCDQQWSKEQPCPRTLLISSGAKPEAVAAARQKYGEYQAAQFAEQTFAALAQTLCGRGIQKMIVAGGETAGAVINALAVTSVRIGTEIAPGVPWVTSLQTPPLCLALKSGNFGGPRFFFDALEMAP